MEMMSIYPHFDRKNNPVNNIYYQLLGHSVNKSHPIETSASAAVVLLKE